jgi:hypothetical protein
MDPSFRWDNDWKFDLGLCCHDGHRRDPPCEAASASSFRIADAAIRIDVPSLALN